MADFEDRLGQILSNPEAMRQVMQLARSLSGEADTPPESAGVPSAAPVPPPERSAGFSPAGPLPDGAGRASIPPTAAPSTPLPGLSPLVQRLLPLLSEGQRDTDARRVLMALRPYLNPRRRENIERALQLARLYRIGRHLLSEWEG